jgi:two-component system response regulator PilR (NtrC family)
MESEFFGHKKGSFTGADIDKTGLFQAAEGGTLFLDEVAELPLPMQVKLLRAIQEKRIRPIGSQIEVPVNVRILSATHKNLAVEAERGSFRQDLFFRINVIEVRVPPLRERREDVLEIAAHIMHRYAQGISGQEYRIAEAAMDALQGYDFPGNVRELENILERAMTLCDEYEIKAGDLRLPQNQPVGMNMTTASGAVNLESYLNDIERKLVHEALEKHHWNLAATAASLSMTLRSLRYRMQKLTIRKG